MEESKEKDLKLCEIRSGSYMAQYVVMDNDKILYDSNNNLESVCFRQYFDIEPQESHVICIDISTDPAVLITHKRSNYMFVNIEQMKAWLDEVQYICSCEINFVETELEHKIYRFDKGCDTIYFKGVKLTILPKTTSKLTQKLICTLVRFLYEYPYSAYLVDAFKMKQLEMFKNETLFNLFNIIYASDKNQYRWPGHAIGKPCPLVTNDEMKNIVESKCNTESINNIFDYNDDRASLILHKMKYLKPSYRIIDWEDDEIFSTQRLPYYLHNYEILLNEKQQNQIQ